MMRVLLLLGLRPSRVRGRGPIEHGVRATEPALLLLPSLLLGELPPATCERAVLLTRGMGVFVDVCVYAVRVARGWGGGEQ